MGLFITPKKFKQQHRHIFKVLPDWIMGSAWNRNKHFGKIKDLIRSNLSRLEITPAKTSVVQVSVSKSYHYYI